LMNQDITIYGNGQQTRSFCYCHDLIDGMLRLMDYTGNDSCLPINVGNPNEFTMLELAEKILTLTKSQSRIIFHPLPSDDPKQRQPDISQANSKLNWKPTVELEDGLLETIQYFRGRLER